MQSQQPGSSGHLPIWAAEKGLKKITNLFTGSGVEILRGDFVFGKSSMGGHLSLAASI